MNTFETLFGLKRNGVKKTCVLTPLLPKGLLKELGIKNLAKGKLYSAVNTDYFTLIRTGVGAGLTGDAVLYLEKTNCENVILFGSCGLVNTKNFKIGDLVTVQKAYNMESFSDLLLSRKNSFKSFAPNKTILNKFASSKIIKKAVCATMGSLKMEGKFLDLFAEKNIDVVDMECSAFFAATALIKLKAAALFYISDIIGKKPFYSAPTQEEIVTIQNSIKIILELLTDFAKHTIK